MRGTPEPDMLPFLAAPSRPATLSDAMRLGWADAFENALITRLFAHKPPTPRMRDSVALGLVAASQAIAAGHVCAELGKLAGAPLEDKRRRAHADTARADDEDSTVVTWPALRTWLGHLGESRLVGQTPADGCPLVLVGTRLYLARYRDFELRVLKSVKSRIDAPAATAAVPSAAKKAVLDTLFGEDDLDLQRRAVATALERRLTVLAGGPGTGKTTTVLRLLAAQVALWPPPVHSMPAHDAPPQDSADRGAPAAPPMVRLLAPTGKAAARMSESIARGLERLAAAAPDLAAPLLPTAAGPAIIADAQTIHAALGLRPGVPDSAKHHAAHPLPADIVVIDEASMIDLSLMTRLLEALSPETHVVILGDPDQLASVEAGAIFGDVCGVGQPAAAVGPSADMVAKLAALGCAIGPGEDPPAKAPGIADVRVTLKTSHRFDARSALGALARAVRVGDAPTVRRLLSAQDPAVIHHGQLPPHPAAIAQLAAPYQNLCAAQDAETAFAALSQYRVLTTLRRSMTGVTEVNRAITAHLVGQKWLPAVGQAGHRRPVLVTKNDRRTRLSNGDVGLVWQAPNSAPTVYFDTPAWRQLSPGRLGPHEDTFAMTIHKSQGSEWDVVAVVLPSGDSPLLTRELLYTAITRAKSSVVLYGAWHSIEAALSRPVQRASGLGDALWAAAD